MSDEMLPVVIDLLPVKDSVTGHCTPRYRPSIADRAVPKKNYAVIVQLREIDLQDQTFDRWPFPIFLSLIGAATAPWMATLGFPRPFLGQPHRRKAFLWSDTVFLDVLQTKSRG